MKRMTQTQTKNFDRKTINFSRDVLNKVNIFSFSLGSLVWKNHHYKFLMVGILISIGHFLQFYRQYRHIQGELTQAINRFCDTHHQIKENVYVNIKL